MDYLQGPTYLQRLTFAGEGSRDTVQAKIILAIPFDCVLLLYRGQGKENAFPILGEEPKAHRGPRACPLLAVPAQCSSLCSPTFSEAEPFLPLAASSWHPGPVYSIGTSHHGWPCISPNGEAPPDTGAASCVATGTVLCSSPAACWA